LIYKLVYKTFGSPKRGANISSHEYSNIDERINLCDISDIQNINDIRDNNSTLVFITQGTHLYDQKYNFIKSKPTDVVYIRQEHVPKLYNNPVNNGFSYVQIRERGASKFIRNNDFKYYSPMFYNFNVRTHKKEGTVLGYYVRPNLTPDGTLWFIDFLNNLEHPIDLYTMGIYINYKDHPNVKSQVHTYDRFEFFTNVSHYVYFKSNMFKDPYPNSLMEAVQSNCQIIIPDNSRKFDDGIDDIISCIDYHNCLNNDIIDNTGSVLNKDFTMYIKKLIDKGFKYTPIDELKDYKDLKEYIIENVR